MAVDASGAFSLTQREVGIARIVQAGVIPVDYASIMAEIMGTNADPLAAQVYAAVDMDFAVLVGEIVGAEAAKTKTGN